MLPTTSTPPTVKELLTEAVGYPVYRLVTELTQLSMVYVSAATYSYFVIERGVVVY